jgi:hypothetical protein
METKSRAYLKKFSKVYLELIECTFRFFWWLLIDKLAFYRSLNDNQIETLANGIFEGLNSIGEM